MKKILLCLMFMLLFAVGNASIQEVVEADNPSTELIVAETELTAETTPVYQQVVSEAPPAEGYETYFLTFAAFIVLVNLLTQWIKKITETQGLAIQIFSWLIGIILSIFGFLFNLGFFADLSIWLALAYGFGASLVANGIFDTGLVSWVLSLFGVRTVKK